MFWFKPAVQALLLGASFTDAFPFAPNNARDLKSCNNNLVLDALRLLRATQFCTDFLHITTVTVRRTASATIVVPATTTTSTTTTNAFTITTSTTSTATTTTVATVNGPSVTVTTTVTGTTTSTVVNSFTTITTSYATVVRYQKNMRRRSDPAPSQDAVAERQRQLSKVGPRGEAELGARALVIPSQLRVFASSVISTACGCYVTTPSTTVTTTATSASTSFSTVIAVFTTSTPKTTLVLATTTTTTATTTTTLPGTTTTTSVPATTTTVTTTSTTSTVVVPATTTVTAPGTYTLQFSGNNCVQNKYNHYDLVNEAYTTPDRLFQVCAARCASYESGCKSFFAYQDNDYPYQWCLIDNEPYDPSYRQCSIPFSGVNLAYNSPY